MSSKKNFGNPPLDVFCHTCDRYDKKPFGLFSVNDEFAKSAIDNGVKKEAILNFLIKSCSDK